MVHFKSKLLIINLILLISIVVLSSTGVVSAPSYQVTNGYGSGAGSLRDALKSGATVISIHKSVPTININNTLEYLSARPLTILGSEQTVDGNDLEETLLE